MRIPTAIKTLLFTFLPLSSSIYASDDPAVQYAQMMAAPPSMILAAVTNNDTAGPILGGDALTTALKAQAALTALDGTAPDIHTALTKIDTIVGDVDGDDLLEKVTTIKDGLDAHAVDITTASTNLDTIVGAVNGADFLEGATNLRNSLDARAANPAVALGGTSHATAGVGLASADITAAITNVNNQIDTTDATHSTLQKVMNVKDVLGGVDTLANRGAANNALMVKAQLDNLLARLNTLTAAANEILVACDNTNPNPTAAAGLTNITDSFTLLAVPGTNGSTAATAKAATQSAAITNLLKALSDASNAVLTGANPVSLEALMSATTRY